MGKLTTLRTLALVAGLTLTPALISGPAHAVDNMSTGEKVRHPNPSTNPYAKRLADYTKQSMRLAICGLTLKAYVEIIAKETGAEQDAVRSELTANAIGRAQFVPAGIIAVTRAQEHGYAVVSIG